MFGCKMQWYVKDPAVLKVCTHDPPDLIMSLSNDPSVAVTVCAALPLLAKDNVPPSANRKVAGVNPLSLMAMDPVAAPPAAAAAATLVELAGCVPAFVAAGVGVMFAGAAGVMAPSDALAMTVPTMSGWISQK
jgi:hypothetical protein